MRPEFGPPAAVGWEGVIQRPSVCVPKADNIWSGGGVAAETAYSNSAVMENRVKVPLPFAHDNAPTATGARRKVLE